MGSPACMMITPQLLSLTNSTILGSVKPVTSFTIEAPTRTAALATSTCRVSIDTMAPFCASARTTGSTRRASSSALTGVKPGRVDSPPTSMMSAPSSSICRPYAMAASASKCSPPSLKLSGVTLRTPMMRGRSNLSSNLPQRHVFESFAMSTLSCAYSSPYCIQTERVWRHMSAGCTSNARAVRMGWVLDKYLDEEFLLTAGAPTSLITGRVRRAFGRGGAPHGRGPTGRITGCVRPWRASEHPLDKPAGAPA